MMDMYNTEEQAFMEYVEDTFKEGHTLLRINHAARQEKVKLDLEKELLPYSYKMVDLLSPHAYHERSLLYMYTEELISLLPRVKEEDIMNRSILTVLETLLLAMDYLTHERFTYAPFEDKHREKLYEILEDCFEKTKRHTFSEYANRPSLNKSAWYQNEDEVYCLDQREEKTRIYMAVVYKKPKNMMEHFKHVGYWLSQINLKPNMNPSKVTYEEMLQGKTEHGLHVDTIYYLGMVQRTISWFLNTTSWRYNQLLPFDEIDIRCKLGLR
jgi:hypothetical protein